MNHWVKTMFCNILNETESQYIFHFYFSFYPFLPRNSSTHAQSNCFIKWCNYLILLFGWVCFKNYICISVYVLRISFYLLVNHVLYWYVKSYAYSICMCRYFTSICICIPYIAIAYVRTNCIGKSYFICVLIWVLRIPLYSFDLILPSYGPLLSLITDKALLIR